MYIISKVIYVGSRCMCPLGYIFSYFNGCSTMIFRALADPQLGTRIPVPIQFEVASGNLTYLLKIVGLPVKHRDFP